MDRAPHDENEMSRDVANHAVREPWDILHRPVQYIEDCSSGSSLASMGFCRCGISWLREAATLEFVTDSA